MSPRFIKVKTCRRSVTTAGTPEKFESNDPAFYAVLAITIRADEDNTGNLYLGDSNRVSTTDYSYILAPGETVSLDATRVGNDIWIDLTRLWLEADNDANSCSFIALTWSEAW